MNGYNNYQCIPATIAPVKTRGSAMKLTARGSDLIAPYWEQFEKYSQYKVVLIGDNVPTCLTTKNGDKSVGAIYKSKNSNGTLILVPDIDFYQEGFIEEGQKEQHWTREALRFAADLEKAILAIDKALKSEDGITPEPEWAKNSIYELASEASIRATLLETEETLVELQGRKEKLLDELREAGRLRNLLFEKGKPLEQAVIDALRIIGFTASQYRDAESEFDVVFEAHEGRLIGEIEGKDKKAVGIDKLRQLEMNIHEDLEQEEVSEPAKSVLFGNAYRLNPVSERADAFTAKCVSAARRSSTALVFTPDLFVVARHLSDKKNARFATRCRKAILSSTGVVTFPEVPLSESLSEDAVDEGET